MQPDLIELEKQERTKCIYGRIIFCTYGRIPAENSNCIALQYNGHHRFVLLSGMCMHSFPMPCQSYYFMSAGMLNTHKFLSVFGCDSLVHLCNIERLSGQCKLLSVFFMGILFPL